MSPLTEGCSILFADDGADDRFLMQAAWREAGARSRLLTVSDGDEVVRFLEARPAGAPWLVILDLKMPRLNGLETLGWIRRSPEWRTLPTIILSASNAPSDVRAAYELCANAYVTKPGTLEELIDFVKAVGEFWGRFSEFPRP